MPKDNFIRFRVAGWEVVVTHMNTDHMHNHIIMNSVDYETGRKYPQSAHEMRMAKEYSNQLCLQYGLSVTETKADPFRIPAWKAERGT